MAGPAKLPTTRNFTAFCDAIMVEPPPPPPRPPSLSPYLSLDIMMASGSGKEGGGGGSRASTPKQQLRYVSAFIFLNYKVTWVLKYSRSLSLGRQKLPHE